MFFPCSCPRNTDNFYCLLLTPLCRTRESWWINVVFYYCKQLLCIIPATNILRYIWRSKIFALFSWEIPKCGTAPLGFFFRFGFSLNLCLLTAHSLALLMWVIFVAALAISMSFFPLTFHFISKLRKDFGLYQFLNSLPYLLLFICLYRVFCDLAGRVC